MAFYRVTTRITGAQGSPWINTLSFDADASGTAAQAASAAATFWGALDAKMDTSSSWVQDPTVVVVNEVNGHPVDFATITPGSGAGAVADLSLPYSVQALIRAYTTNVVNSHLVRGRVNVPGITRNDMGEGVLAAGAITAFDAAGAALIADANSTWVIWSRPVTVPTERTEVRDGSIHAVLSVSTSPQFAVLRSRRD